MWSCCAPQPLALFTRGDLYTASQKTVRGFLNLLCRNAVDEHYYTGDIEETPPLTELRSAEELPDATLTFSSNSYLIFKMRKCLSACSSSRKRVVRVLLVETMSYSCLMSRCNASTNQTIVSVEEILWAQTHVTKTSTMQWKDLLRLVSNGPPKIFRKDVAPMFDVAAPTTETTATGDVPDEKRFQLFESVHV